MVSLQIIGRFNDFFLLWGYCQLTAEMRSQLLRFWAENGAITDANEAWRRSFEVGCIVANSDGEVLGVNSFYIDRLAVGGPTYWMYRTFLRPDCRKFGLSARVLNATAEQLSIRYGHEKGAPVGIAAVIENLKLETPGGMRYMHRNGLRRLGSDAQGRAVWFRALNLV